MQHVLARVWTKAVYTTVSAILISNNSRFLYVSVGGEIIIFDAESGDSIRTIRNIDAGVILSMCLNNEGTIILVGTGDFKIMEIRISDGEILKRYPTWGRTLKYAFYSNSNDFVFGYDASITQFTMSDFTFYRDYPNITADVISCIISRNDAYILAGDTRGDILCFTTLDGSLKKRITNSTPYSSMVHTLQWINDVSFISDSRGCLELFSFPNCELLRTYNIHDELVISLAVAFDGTEYVTGNSRGQINLWHIDRDTPLATMQQHNEIINAVSISPNGKFIISGSFDGPVNRYSVTPPFLHRSIDIFNYFQSLMLLSRVGMLIPKHVMIITAKYALFG